MMMKRLALCALFVTTSYALTHAAAAQGMGSVPANFPPADFAGAQFADSRGCVFVRAGSGGSVTWVPRVTRQRKQICGQTPTFGKAQASVQTAQAPAAAKPTVITPAPQSASQSAARTTAAPAPARVTSSATAVSTPRHVIKAPASKPVSAPLPRVVRRVPTTASASAAQSASASASTSAFSAPVISAPSSASTSGGLYGHTIAAPRSVSAPVYKGAPGSSASSAHANMHRPIGAYGQGGLAPNTRIVPRHVYEGNQDTQSGLVPHGYRPAWEDDRLNPYRAVQTVQGHRATQSVWTNTVPRRLVSQEPQKVPFPQKLWTPQYEHEVTAPTVAYRVSGPYPDVSRTAYRQGYVSTSGEASRSHVASKGGYVEIGVFSTEAKARAAAARIGAAGLSVRATPVSHKGQPMQRLRVGPFSSGTTLAQALTAVHRAGYTQAYTR